MAQVADLAWMASQHQNYYPTDENHHKRQRLDHERYSMSIAGLTNGFVAASTAAYDAVRDVSQYTTGGSYHLEDPFPGHSWVSAPDSQTFGFSPAADQESNVPSLSFDLEDSFGNGPIAWHDDNLYTQQYSNQQATFEYEDHMVEFYNAPPKECAHCFGMVSNVPITSSRSGLSTISSSSISLRFCPPNSLYNAFGEGEFGTLEERPAKIFGTLASQNGIEFQMYAYATKRRSNLKSVKGKKAGENDLQYLMNVIIYGPVELCEPVGEYLSKCRMFLQDPTQCDRDVPYQNPHILAETPEIVMTSSLIIEQAKDKVEVETVDAPKDLFSQLSSDDHLQLTATPSALRTSLYKHQMKALTFMIQREQGWSYEESQENLWVREVDETGELIYTNLATERSQRNPPPVSRGGLLADQMGLGKSLTMISLIAANPADSKASVIYTSQGTIRRIKSTLVVVPYSLLDTWDAQLRRHLKAQTLSWVRFHGSQKRKLLSLGGYDIVITTFETVVGQQKKHNDVKCLEDTLFSFAWHRIVLDEAHVIRNRSTAMAQACCAIRAGSRWAMTGTPIQNRPTDLGSLLEYLQLYPFSNPKVFEAEVIKPWLKSNDRDITRLKKLIKYVSLCRTKQIIDLPQRKDEIHYLDLSPKEQEFYEMMKTRTVQKLDEALSFNPLAPGQYLNALEWLNELRLICNHGLMHSRKEPQKSSVTVSHDGPWNKVAATKAFEILVSNGGAICKLCQANMAEGTGESAAIEVSKPSLSKCLTLICGSCIQNRPGGEKVPTCSCSPVCPKVEVSWAPETAVDHPGKQLPTMKGEQVSTKLNALLKSLQEHHATEKSVVFSFWTYTLDLVESLLKPKSISYTRIDGSLSGARREEAIQRFQTTESVRVILVSITCGGTGLDLTAASRAYLLEPQWNPMIEEQALSRIHRLGQTKEVQTIRYRIRGSFEEKVAMIQDVKKEIAAGAFSSEQQVGINNGSSRLQEFRAAFE